MLIEVIEFSAWALIDLKISESDDSAQQGRVGALKKNLPYLEKEQLHFFK